MFRVKTNSIPEALQNKFKAIEHNYSKEPSNQRAKYVCGISILPSFWKQQTRFHFLESKPKIAS